MRHGLRMICLIIRIAELRHYSARFWEFLQSFNGLKYSDTKVRRGLEE